MKKIKHQLFHCRKFCPSGIWNLELNLPKEQGLFGPKARFLALLCPVSVLLGPFLTQSSSLDEQKTIFLYIFDGFFHFKTLWTVCKGGWYPPNPQLLLCQKFGFQWNLEPETDFT